MKMFTWFSLLFLAIACRNTPEETSLTGDNLNLAQYASVADSNTNHLVFRSDDDGKTWQNMSAGLPTGAYVADIYVKENEVLVYGNMGIYRSSIQPGRTQWQKMLFPESFVTQLMPADEGLIGRSVDNNFYQEMPSSGIWIPLYKSLENRPLYTILKLEGTTVLSGSDNGLYKSNDTGQTWRKVSSEDFVSNIVRKGNLLLATSSKHILRSTDGGENWTPVMEGVGTYFGLGTIGDRFFAITDGNGMWDDMMAQNDSMANHLLISDQNGENWKHFEKAFFVGRDIFNYQDHQPSKFINDLETNGQYLFCSLNSGIFRSADGGITWELVLTPPKGFMYRLAKSGKTIFAVKANSQGGC
ncbi:MAG: hypothetical protein IT269_05495 [Saprospiraceae bacterium]|nr:hypothetical protein [Saprospiraceae bacterium]